MEIKRGDLFYKDYSWNTTLGDDPHKIVSDRNLFNRHEGYEVLSMLNHMVKDLRIADKNYVLELEIFIRERLPANVRGAEKVRDALRVKFLKGLLEGR